MIKAPGVKSYPQGLQFTAAQGVPVAFGVAVPVADVASVVGVTAPTTGVDPVPGVAVPVVGCTVGIRISGVTDGMMKD